jgi:hypothetical protein
MMQGFMQDVGTRGGTVRIWKRVAAVLLGCGVLAGAALCQRWPVHTLARTNEARTALAILLGACMLFQPVAEGVRRHVGRLYTMRAGVFRWALFCIALAACLAIARYIFHGVPRIDDGIAALFQARIFARLRLTLPLPAVPGFFETFGVLGDQAGLGHWCGMYPPGWPLLLTPGVWLGAPWAVAPLLGALLIVSLVVLGRELFDETTGRTAGLLALGSPFVLVLSGLHLSHMPTALCSVWCLLACARLVRTADWRYGLLAGLTWGMAFLCRPLTAVVAGAVFGLCILLPCRRWRRCGPGAAAGLAAALLAAAAYLLFQYVITHDAGTPGHVIGMGARGKFGFVRLDAVRTHTVALGFRNTCMRIQALNDGVLNWLIPSGFVCAVPFLMGRRRGRELVLLLPAAALLVVFAFFWYFESFFPARYVTAGVPLLILLCARGLVLLRRAWGRHARRLRLFDTAVAANIAFLCLVGLPMHGKRYDACFGDVEPVLEQVVADCAIHNAVVFMDARGTAHGRVDPNNITYGTGFMRNDLDLRGDVIYVRHSRGRNSEILAMYPDRAFYLYVYRRDMNKAHLYRMRLDAGRFRYEPVSPDTSPHLAEAPPYD